MLQYVSNQVGDFSDMFEDQVSTVSALQTGCVSSALQPTIQTPQTPQTPAPAAYQTTSVGLPSSQTLSLQSVPLTPPLTPALTPSPITAPSVHQQVIRSPPLLQPRPQMIQPIQPQPQQTVPPTIQVSNIKSFIYSSSSSAVLHHARALLGYALKTELLHVIHMWL